jgi:acyl carrier protein
MSPSPSPGRAQVVLELRAFVAQWFRGGREEGLGDDTPLVTSGIVDSAGVVEIVDFVEKQFGVAIGDADVSLANCNTLAAWADLVLRKAGHRAPGGHGPRGKH